jgi:hypothetical protein
MRSRSVEVVKTEVRGKNDEGKHRMPIKKTTDEYAT